MASVDVNWTVRGGTCKTRDNDVIVWNVLDSQFPVGSGLRVDGKLLIDLQNVGS